MKLLFVSSVAERVYTNKWRPELKLLLVTQLDAYARAVNTIAKYVETGRRLGHEVAVFGEERSEKPFLPCSLDVEAFDYAIFVVYETTDFPDLPYLAHLLDRMPRERRITIDCCGRYNDTIRIEHDFNHLEKLDGHQGWEWVEGLEAVSNRILQPTLSPLRSDVEPFLFHGFDPADVNSSLASPAEAALAWSENGSSGRPYGTAYVGNNWQRWTQMKRFLEALEPLGDDLGQSCLAGWGWDQRPEWAAELGLHGVDVDPALLERLGVETKWGIPFDEIAEFVGQARFCPVIHRPLFNELGLVTNRTFETFTFDTIPLLLLPEEMVESIYGTDALALAGGDDITGKVSDMLARPEFYWDVVFKTRAYLATHHSFEQRFKELEELLEA